MLASSIEEEERNSGGNKSKPTDHTCLIISRHVLTRKKTVEKATSCDGSNWC